MYRIVKRVCDFITALGILILVAPLLLLIYLGLLVFSKEPIFKQTRVGLNEMSFTLYKFRTLDDQGKKPTWFGAILRRSSLDELPQLLNVLKGEMSLVGPRPLLVRYLPLYNAEQRKRHDVLPGITGWAQIRGRNLLSWKEQFEMDSYYAANRSFVLDTKILLLTFLGIFRGRKGETRMREAFNGRN